jgi:uncharacterized protein YjeT (DUF2065 family)
MKLLVSLLGLVLILEGLPYAAFPEPMQQWLKQMVVMPPKLLRIFGFLAITAGLFLCYITQKTSIFG